MLKNIIFDFGGVIININPELTLHRFLLMAPEGLSPYDIENFQKHVSNPFETGHLTPEVFRDELRKALKTNAHDDEIDYAWNLTILDTPSSRTETLKLIRNNYRLFLLSNTNIIHFRKYTDDFLRVHRFDLESLFEKAYWSFREGLRKPDLTFFRRVLNENRMNPEETLFIDDTAMHTEAAKKLGIVTLFLEEGMDINNLFTGNTLKSDLKFT